MSESSTVKQPETFTWSVTGRKNIGTEEEPEYDWKTVFGTGDSSDSAYNNAVSQLEGYEIRASSVE